MKNKIFSHSIKALKISTWASVIATLLVILVIGFFVVFPTFLKAPIEQQLSAISGLEVRLSKITFGLDDGKIEIHIHNIEVGSQAPQPLLLVDDLRWQLDWLSVFDDIYNPNKIDIQTLNIYSEIADMSMADIYQILTPEMLDTLAIFQTVRVNKTIVSGSYNFELLPLILDIDKQQLLLKIVQKFGAKTFDINANFSLAQVEKRANLSLPISITNADFKLDAELLLFSEKSNDFIEFKGVAKRLKMVDVADYLPAEIVGKLTNKWMRQAFLSGELENINIYVKQNMAGPEDININFAANVREADLLFDQQWPALQRLDADISTNGKWLKIKANSAVLDKLSLQNIDVNISDLSAEILQIEVAGGLNSQSENIISFLKNTPLKPVVMPIFEQFTLSGKAAGELNLLIYLDDLPPIIDVDLQLENNHLSVLEEAVRLEDFNSKVSFHNNIISTKGTGKIRGEPFEIRVNPSDRKVDKNDLFAVELVNLASEFNLYIRQKSKQLWQAKVSSEALQTDIEIALNENDFPIVTLNNLQVATLDKIKGDWQILPNDLPNMHLRSQNMQVDGYRLPDFKADLRSEAEVLNIHNLEFEGVGVNDNNLSFDGNWLDGITTLVASAKGDKLSDFLAKMNIKEKVEGGEFDFDIRLFCQCEPWNINLQDISGYASMRVREGVFTEQDPNIGRVLSLLNIQSIARRLKLQVDDLTSQGFVYDDILANVYLGNSLAKIDKFELNATSSSIHLSGNSNIARQQYNLVATVRPAVGDSIPIATFLAGGGLAGLGVWAVDKILFDGKVIDAVVDNVAEFEYKITGDWDNPIIK
ncbi:MAG: DUF3971 domain-containing protein [Candidatus Thioglobus sp.]|nr:DUF3971 domain-containing protein [Candidatus Thioglobus sp.]